MGFASSVALHIVGAVSKKLSPSSNTEPTKFETEMTTSQLIQFYASGAWFDPELMRSTQNHSLMAKVASREWLEGLRAQEKPPHIVLGRWELNSPRERACMLHKLCSDFNADGEVSATTSRSEQHARLAYLSCPRRHPVADVAPMELSQIAQSGGQVGCGICNEPVIFDPAAIQNVPMGFTIWPPKRCTQCQWWVCSSCMLLAEQKQWVPRVQNAQTEAQV